MVNLVTGLLAIVMIAVFLGNYAIRIAAVPLWVIILAILAMVIADYVLSLKDSKSRNGA